MVSTRELTLFTLLIAGSALMHFYFYNVDLNPQPSFLLYIGIGLQAASATGVALQVLRSKESKISLSYYSLFIFSLAISQAAIALTRFSIIPGTDILTEVQAAQITLDLGRWDPSLAEQNRYIPSLAVTILPSLLAGATGISNLYHIFGLLNVAVIGIIPVAVILLVTRLFKSVRLGVLSSLLLAQNYFFYYGVNFIMKTTFAFLLLILGLLCLTYRPRSYVVLGVLFLSFVTMMHYTVGLFALFFLISVAFSRRFLPSSPGKGSALTSFRVLALYGGVMSGWLILVATHVLVSLGQIAGSTAQILSQQSISSVVLGADNISLQKRVEGQYLVSSPAGPLITTFFEIQTILFFLGGVMLVAEVMRGRVGGKIPTHLLTIMSSKVKIWKNIEDSTASYILGGFASAGLLVIWLALPVVSSAVSIFRVLNFALVLAPFFLAVALYRFINPRSAKVLKVTGIAFLLLMLPMAMMLPNHERNILYHPIDYFESQKQLDMMSTGYPTLQDQALVGWVTSHLPAGSEVRTDAVGRYVMKTFLPVDTTVAWEVSADPGEWPTYTNTTRYFLLNEISMREGTWAIVRLGAHYFSSFEVAPLFDEGQNLIFNSGRFFLLKHAG